MELDPVVVRALIEAEAITQEEKNVWTIGANALMRERNLQPLTEKGTEQAIDKIAYEISKRSIELMLKDIDWEEGIKEYEEDTKQLDDIISTVAITSRTHVAIITAKVAVRTQEYTDEYFTKLFKR